MTIEKSDKGESKSGLERGDGWGGVTFGWAVGM